MPAFLSQQVVAMGPVKPVFAVIAVVFFVVRIPIWLLWFALPQMRQNPAWSFRQALRVRIVRAFLYNMSLLQPRIPEKLTAGGEKTQWTVISPADPSSFVGVTKSDVLVKPGKVGVTWYPKPPAQNEKPSGLVTLHFHGGAYVIGDGRKDDCGFLAKTLLKNTGASYVLCPQYRLACNPGNKFPSQLQDAISSYAYLTKELGIDPKKIVLSGDSAGGNLALSLLRYLEQHGSTIDLPLPGAATLWSPWPSPVRSYESPEEIFESPNYETDYLSHMFGHWGAVHLAPRKYTGLTLHDPYISFIGNAFKTSVPICITTGESEALYHDNVELYEDFKNAGNDVVQQFQPYAVHDIILVGEKIGFDAEAGRAAVEVGKWLKEKNVV